MKILKKERKNTQKRTTKQKLFVQQRRLGKEHWYCQLPMVCPYSRVQVIFAVILKTGVEFSFRNVVVL